MHLAGVPDLCLASIEQGCANLQEYKFTFGLGVSINPHVDLNLLRARGDLWSSFEMIHPA